MRAKQYMAVAVLVVAQLLLVPPGSAQAPCPALPPAAGPTTSVSTPAQLEAAVNGAAAGDTILLQDGFYDLSGVVIWIDTPNLTLRSASGNREAVVLDGDYDASFGELLSIHASGVTIADLTLQRAYNHPIHITGTASGPISGILLHNLHIIDPGQQAVKVNPISTGVGTVDDSTIECSLIELTRSGRPHIRDNCYTGGIDAHDATGWRVWRNRIQGFWCASGLSEHGIHFWRQSQDTIVEDNVVLDCARGIGFGLGEGAEGHSGGIIRNNFVAAADTDLFDSEYGFDGGIALWGAGGAQVYHNTVAATQAPFASIEWRFASTTAEIANNLVTHSMVGRNGATANLTTNIVGAPASWFASIANGDLHLVDPGSAPVNAATPLAAGLCDSDIDGEIRDSAPDIGADELGEPLFVDGFESGTTAAWSVTVP